MENSPSDMDMKRWILRSIGYDVKKMTDDEINTEYIKYYNGQLE